MSTGFSTGCLGKNLVFPGLFGKAVKKTPQLCEQLWRTLVYRTQLLTELCVLQSGGKDPVVFAVGGAVEVHLDAAVFQNVVVHVDEILFPDL